MKIKVSRGTISIGPYLMASGSGGGSPGGPPKPPKAPTIPKPPKSWWQKLKEWLADKLSV